MPFEHHWRKRSLYKRFFGDTTPNDFMLSVELTHGDPRFDELRYTINDFTEATLPQLSQSEVMAFAAHGIGAAYSNAQIQIVVITQDLHAHEMALRYALVAPFKLKVFETREEANAWLPAAHRIGQRRSR